MAATRRQRNEKARAWSNGEGRPAPPRSEGGGKHDRAVAEGEGELPSSRSAEEEGRSAAITAWKSDNMAQGGAAAAIFFVRFSISQRSWW